jgi:hypothetical protein
MKAVVRLLVPLVAIGWATTSGASYLTIEPMINFVPGSGQTADSFPLYDPGSSMPPMASIPSWQTNLAKSIPFR